MKPPLFSALKQTNVCLVILVMSFGFLLLNCDKIFGQTQKPYSNPALIFGTDFGRMFQVYYKQGKFDTMLQFTSRQSLNKFGSSKIKEYYSSMDFGYNLKLKSINKKENKYTMNYQVEIFATMKILRIVVIVENDSSKIILPDNFQEQKLFLVI